MGIILLIVTVCAIVAIIFYISKMGKIKEAEKKDQEGMKRDEANEKIIRPEIKLHEEEKKRWEDEYWKRQERKER